MDELAAETGQKPGPKVEWLLYGERLYHREGKDWYCYP